MPYFPLVKALPASSTDKPLRFSILEGEVANEFLRQGPVAAHMLLSSGRAARLIVAFPAGNSAAGLWFEPGADACHWEPVEQLEPVHALDHAGRVLYGVDARLALRCGPLTVRTALLSSARVLRDYQASGTIPPAVLHQFDGDAGALRWWRDRADGGAGYALSLRLEAGTAEAGADGAWRLRPGKDGLLRMRVTALCGERPLVPMAMPELLRAPEAGDARTRNSLAFLSYQEKLLAGSWRFNTYFGRDTLMSLALLMPALTPRAIDAALGAVLARLGGAGAVAHEEDIGECAWLYHGASPAEEPVCDYKMVDDDFMLAPVLARCLAERTPAEAAAFLGRQTPAGHSYRALVLRNIELVMAKAWRFAAEPVAANLVGLKPGEATGDWRDSEDGLGGGRYSYNVNAVLVPAALRAIAMLNAGGILGPDSALAGVAMLAEQWETHAPPLFKVVRGAAQAQREAADYAAELGLDPDAVPVAGAGLEFHALALDAAGRPVPVMHSDFGFALLLQHPPADMIERELAALMRPFPAGLMTDVGLLVANAAYAGAALRPRFGPDRYHGAVVWSWQQALLAAGLARQRRRADLPPSTLAVLARAEQALWPVIHATRARGNSELWSWQYRDGRHHWHPFGPSAATADESNAAQLWSTVYLAVVPPAQTM